MARTGWLLASVGCALLVASGCGGKEEAIPPCHGNTGAIPNGDGSGKPDRACYRETDAISISFGDIRTHFGGDTGHPHSLDRGDTNGSGDTDHFSLADGDTRPNPQPDTGSRAPTAFAVPSGVRHSNHRIRNKTNDDYRCRTSSKRALAASNPRDRHGP